MMMDVWTQGAGVVLDVKHDLKQQQMFVIGALYRYSVITCSQSQKGDKINLLWPATIGKEMEPCLSLVHCRRKEHQFQPVRLNNPEPNVSVYQLDKSLKKGTGLKSCFWLLKHLIHIHIRMCLFCTVACSKKVESDSICAPSDHEIWRFRRSEY